MSSTAGLLDSKWAVPGLDVLTARRARGLHGTFREEQEEGFLLKEEKVRSLRPHQISFLLSARSRLLTAAASLCPTPVPEFNQAQLATEPKWLKRMEAGYL
ncbi:hypothetical protein V8E54_013394 [Elaphomyces granulatus]